MTYERVQFLRWKNEMSWMAAFFPWHIIITCCEYARSLLDLRQLSNLLLNSEDGNRLRTFYAILTSSFTKQFMAGSLGITFDIIREHD